MYRTILYPMFAYYFYKIWSESIACIELCYILVYYILEYIICIMLSNSQVSIVENNKWIILDPLGNIFEI